MISGIRGDGLVLPAVPRAHAWRSNRRGTGLMIASRVGFRRLVVALATTLTALLAVAAMSSPAASADTLALGGLSASPFASLAAPLTASSGSPTTIAEYGTDAGQVSSPQGAAVDRSNGDLYIAEFNNRRVSKFDSEGKFLFAVGYGVADGVTKELQTCGPQATPPTKHCVFANFYPVGLFAESVAVDNSAGPSRGDFYVSEPFLQHRVSKFTSSGQLIFMVGRNVNKTKVEEAGATQAEKDFCTASSGDSCGQGESGTAANEFSGGHMPLAVDSNGVVWVGDNERLISFSPAGAPGAEVSLAGAGDTHSLALDSSNDFYVGSESITGIRKLQAGTGTLLETLDASGQAWPVTLDEAGNVYIGDSTSPYRFKVYNPSGEQVAQFGADQVIGDPGREGTNAIAVDKATGKLYTASSSPSESESVVQAFPLPEPGPLPENEHVENLLPTTVTLTASLNPEDHKTTYHFEWGTSESYGATTPTQTLTAQEFEPETVEAQLKALIPSITYHFRLCATNSAGTVCGPDSVFTTSPPVAIDPEWATGVTAHTAELHTEMDPLGVEAEAWLEWGTDEGYGHLVPLANLGEGFGAVARQAALTGLQPGTAYHYRFTARDTRDGHVYTVHGADRGFTTQVGSLGFRLADNRAWEMVSPSEKHGARLVGGGEIHLQASVDGNGLAYQSYLSTEVDPEGNRILESSMNLARRQADGSWLSKDITPPNQNVTSPTVGEGTEYKLFNADLSEAIVDPRSGTPLSPQASERTPYLRENTEPPLYTPLVTGKEPYANVPPGIEFGGRQIVTAIHLVAVSPDFRHFGLGSEVALVEGVPTFGGTLYEWSGGQIEPVSVLPASEGGTIVEAGFMGSGPGSARGAISEDGSRVFWSRGNTTSTISALYVRDTQAGESGRLDVSQAGAAGSGKANPVFQGASADGTVVFFTDSQQLTEDASSKGADLYRCELPLGVSIMAGCATLTDISVPTGAHESAEVQGIAAGFTGDGAKIYFVAKGVLDGAPNQLGESAVSGQPNLYVWEQGAGVRFIATLSGEDRTDWRLAGALTAAASPSGRYLGFMSQRSLTGYDNRDESSAEAAQEVFRYDSASEQLECVSCNPSGARPHSAVPSHAYRAFIDPWELWTAGPVAATLPEATQTTSLQGGGASLYRPRAVLDNGRVFFNAVDSLVPTDSNGQWDVYEYEPTGVGDCSASSGGAGVSRSAGGCVSLISSGTAEGEAAFFDASETGNDAFFWTPAQLSVFDEDHEVDIYDARVGGITAVRPLNAECLGEACQPAVQAPNDQTPSSATFQGPGNHKPSVQARCARNKRLVRRKGHTGCVSKRVRHKHRGKHSKHRRAHKHRGAHR